MKTLLVTAVVTAFVLALFLRSGNGLVCYDCHSAVCKTAVTCEDGLDTCIVIRYTGGNLSGCWKHEKCNVKDVSNAFGLGTFKSWCCSSDLCNNAPKIPGSKIVLSGALLLTIVYMLKSLV